MRAHGRDVGMATAAHTPLGRGYNKSLSYFHHHVDYWTGVYPQEDSGPIGYFPEVRRLSLRARHCCLGLCFCLYACMPARPPVGLPASYNHVCACVCDAIAGVQCLAVSPELGEGFRPVDLWEHRADGSEGPAVGRLSDRHQCDSSVGGTGTWVPEWCLGVSAEAEAA